MALVDYSSSDGEQDDAQVQLARGPDDKDKAKDGHNHQASAALPPLPAKFHDLYASTTRVSTSDDPSLHGGRRRVTPHVEGNWPTHLYIEWFPSTAEQASLSAVITALRDSVPPDGLSLHSLLTSDLAAPLPLHVSLSRSIGFATERKHDFVVSVERSIRSSGIRPFHLVVLGLDWVPNFEKTRWFLVLRVSAPGTDGLNKLLHVTNRVVQEHGQPPLYIKVAHEEISFPPPESVRSSSTPVRGERNVEWEGMQDVSDAFHISIAWSLGPPSSDLLTATKAMAMNQLEDVKKMLIRVEEMKTKVGNVVTNVRLPKNVSERNGLLGL